jgi:hypothetical protein
MGGQFVTAAFFIPLAARPADDAALFEVIAPGGALGPLNAQESYVDVLSHHVCVQLKFLRPAFLDLIEERAGDALSDDPALPLAVALRDGAVRARAEVAMLVQEAHVQEALLDRYSLVLTRDADALVAESFSLLYLSDALARDWTPEPGRLDGRDELPGGPGRTIFADSGEDRWL